MALWPHPFLPDCHGVDGLCLWEDYLKAIFGEFF